jgi:hypothetical protein
VSIASAAEFFKPMICSGLFCHRRCVNLITSGAQRTVLNDFATRLSKSLQRRRALHGSQPARHAATK